MSRWEVKTMEEAQKEAWSEMVDRTDECLAIIEERLELKGVVYDLGCGPGRLLVPLAKKYPETMFLGYDKSASMMEFCKIAAEGLKNVEFFFGAEFMPYCDEAYSMLVFQHLTPKEVQGHLNAVFHGLAPGRKFLFQFVEGSYHAQDNHQYTREEIGAMSYRAGFRTHRFEGRMMFPEWVWVTATKEL